MARLTAGTAKLDGSYEGVVRSGRTVVFRCGHHHHNRDQSTGSHGSAYDCVKSLVTAARWPDHAEWRRSGFREAEVRIRQMYGRATPPPSMPTADAQITRYDTQLEQLRGVIGDEPVYGFADSLILSPAVA